MSKQAFLSLTFALFLLVTGCGGSHDESPNRLPLPAAFSRDEFRPNYGGDLAQVVRWTQTEVMFRIADPAKATDIRTNPLLYAVQASSEQSSAIREAFSKWQAGSEDRITFRELAPTDQSANIDIVTVPGSALDNGDGGTFREPNGRTVAWIPPTREDGQDSGFVPGRFGRVVVMVSADLPVRPFRKTVLHEIGHAILGFGHSRNLSDVMYGTSLPEGLIPVIELTARDKNTVRANYAP